MAIQRTHQNSFTRGEVDETFITRTDIDAYQQSLKKARNVFCLNQGPIERRQGTVFRYDLGEETRLEHFIFSENQEYIIAFQNTKLKIFSSNGTLLQSFTSCPWTSAILYELSFTQQADTMIVTHKTFIPQIIKRTSATSFFLDSFAFKVSTNNDEVYQPYFKFADDEITLDIDQTTAQTNVNLTTSADYFESGMVGTRVRYHGSELEITAVTNAKEAIGTLMKDVRIELDDDPLKSEEGGGTITVLHPAHGFASGASITIEGAESILNEDGNGLSATNLNGTFTITVLDDDRYTYTAGGSDTGGDSADGGGTNMRVIGHPPTRQWDEQVYSAYNGFPTTCKFHQQRLFFAGGAIADFIASSKTSEFFNFDVGEAEDTDSIQISISSDQINEIRHIVAGKHLEIFTSTGEFYLKPQVGKPLTPTDLRIERQSNLGSTQVCMPRLFDGAAIFVQPNGKTVREFFYNTATEDYVPTVLTFISPHAINNPQDSAILKASGKRTEQFMMFINGDGTLAVFSAQRQEKLAGWTIWETDGTYISATGLTNFLYIVTKRTINGATKYYLEQVSNSQFAIPTDCSITKILSGSYQPHGTILVNGTVSNQRQLVLDGFVNAPTTGEEFTVNSTSCKIQSVASTGVSGEYTVVVDVNVSASDNASVVFTTSRVFTGLNADPDLRGKIVHATSGSTEDDDIRYYGSATVDSNGNANFQLPASACDIGLNYTVDIETLPVDSATAIRGLGSTYGYPRKIGKTVLELSKTYNLQINGNDLLLNDNGLQMVGYTGKKDVHTLGYTQTPNVQITQTVPVPFRILAITTEVMF
tara:strand:+ start:4878 stop:7328 length:2451 start_codon:yes stop_codon:yes gene_type:complete